MHQLYTNYARYIYACSMHTFRKWYVYYDIRNTIFLRYEMLSSLCPLPYVLQKIFYKNSTCGSYTHHLSVHPIQISTHPTQV